MAAVQPIPGVKIKPPPIPPSPGQVVIGYQMMPPVTGCCKCDTLGTNGWLAVIVAAIIFPCVACVPCLMEGLHESYQYPVYGNPGDVPPPGATAPPPYYGQPPATGTPMGAPPPAAMGTEPVKQA